MSALPHAYRRLSKLVPRRRRYPDGRLIAGVIVAEPCVASPAAPDVPSPSTDAQAAAPPATAAQWVSLAPGRDTSGTLELR